MVGSNKRSVRQLEQDFARTMEQSSVRQLEQDFARTMEQIRTHKWPRSRMITECGHSYRLEGEALEEYERLWYRIEILEAANQRLRKDVAELTVEKISKPESWLVRLWRRL
jgi:hypothetical protein